MTLLVLKFETSCHTATRNERYVASCGTSYVFLTMRLVEPSEIKQEDKPVGI